MFGRKYVKNNPDSIPGAPFPTNLRPSRQNRPHAKPKHSPQVYTPTAEDLEARDPLVLTTGEIDFILTESHKSLLRKGAKFCQRQISPSITTNIIKILLNLESRSDGLICLQNKITFNLRKTHLPNRLGIKTPQN